MGWDYKGQFRGGPTSWTPVLGVANGSGVPYGIGIGSWGTYEIYNGICTAHWGIALNASMIMAMQAVTGEFILSLPVQPVNYDTWLMNGHWFIERFWGGGGYGNLEITRQWYDGTAYAKMLINRYHDDPIAILSAPYAKDYYLWSDSGIICSMQYPVET
jgi:hypothetical protein